MVIYLEEAVERKRAALGAAFTRASLREAVIEGALLRLRPKVMTVSTVVAGLLPIMWSARTGAEVMKPLAAPVLGGMVSSLLHVLVVTPVIFYWLRARQLPRDEEAASAAVASVSPVRRPATGAAAILVLVVAAITIGWALVERKGSAPAERVVTTVTASGLTASLRSGSGGLARGRNEFYIEFRDAQGRLIDAGDVRLAATMAMPGMTMSGGVEVARTSRSGRYHAAGEFAMSGVWQMSLQWSGTAQPGSVSFQENVR
jgi:Cu(I)/Ag(I) efflux system membrane protein CusA/SilA